MVQKGRKRKYRTSVTKKPSIFEILLILVIMVSAIVVLFYIYPLTVSVTGSDIDSYYAIESEELQVNVTVTARMTVSEYDYRSLDEIVVTFTDVGSITLDVVDRESITEVFSFNFGNYGTYIGQISIRGLYIIEGNTKQITRTYDFVIKLETDSVETDTNSAIAFEFVIVVISLVSLGKLKFNKVRRIDDK